MRNITCRLMGNLTTADCYKCFDMTRKDSELAKALWDKNNYVTRAQCCYDNIEDWSDSFVKIDSYEKTETDEIIEGIMENDEDAAFELEGVVWFSEDKMSEYVPAIRTFINQAIKEGYEQINSSEIDSIGLTGRWYRRRKRG